MRNSLTLVAAALAAAGLLAACQDKSPQNADGTTQSGDPGTAAAVAGGADTGRDTGQGGEAGGAGEVIGAPAGTGSTGPGSTGANATDTGVTGQSTKTPPQ